MQSGSFPETYNDLEGLTLKYKKGPENRFSQLVTFFSIHQTFIFKTKQPRGSLKKKALENEDQSTQHEALKSQKQI